MNRFAAPIAFLPLALAAPALACGGGSYEADLLLVALAKFTAGAALVHAALVVDRLAFALGARLMRVQRQHRPSLAGPALGVAGLLTIVPGWSLDRGISPSLVAGATLFCVGALISTGTFARSVRRELPGQRSLKVVRIVGVVGVVALGVGMLATGALF